MENLTVHVLTENPPTEPGWVVAVFLNREDAEEFVSLQPAPQRFLVETFEVQQDPPAAPAPRVEPDGSLRIIVQ